MTVVVFKTKTEVFSFLEDARYYGIVGSVVSTPKEIKIGCGLSAKISDWHAYKARAVIFNGDYPTFYGVFTLRKTANGFSLKKLF